MKPFELDLFPKLGVTVHSIVAGKLQSKFTRYTIPSLLKIPVGFVMSISLIRKIKPEVVLSFGGFAAVPVVMAASLLRIPVVLHEQTVAAGLANRITGFFANKIALARSESKIFFQRAKCIVLGNPLMQEILAVKPTNILPDTPVIFVTGGSRGAQRVNNPIFMALPQLLNSYKVIHQTGQLDFQKALNIKEKLSSSEQKKYDVRSFIPPSEIGSVYAKASLVVARAGANTVSEVMALGIPSIFIPIPWTRADEQTKNAKQAESSGLSLLLPESRLTSETLVDAIETVRKNWKNMSLSHDNKNVELDRTAAQRLVQVISGLL